MKQFWIGVGLLAVLLAAGLWAMFATDRVHSSVSADLQQSAQAAQAGNWEQADRFSGSAVAQWRESWRFSAAMVDHTELDEIDALFAQAEVYRQEREATAYAAACAHLAKQVEALQEGHQLSWWNLL